MTNVLLHFWKHQPYTQYTASYKSLCNILFTLNDELDEYRIDIFLISDKGIYNYIKDHSSNRPDVVINVYIHYIIIYYRQWQLYLNYLYKFLF